MSEWKTVARSAELPPGASLSVLVGKDPVALFNVDGQVFAVCDRCPHAGAPLADGFVEEGRLTCLWHGWSFPLAPDTPINDGLCRYPVRIDGDEIQIQLRDVTPI